MVWHYPEVNADFLDCYLVSLGKTLSNVGIEQEFWGYFGAVSVWNNTRRNRNAKITEINLPSVQLRIKENGRMTHRFKLFVELNMCKYFDTVMITDFHMI